MTRCFWAIAFLALVSASGESDCGVESLSLLQTQFVGVRETQDVELGFSQSNLTRVSGNGCWSLISDAAKCGMDTVEDAAVCGYMMIEDAVRCGSSIITDMGRCGSRMITDAIICGVNSVQRCSFHESEEDEEVALVDEASEGRRRRRRRAIFSSGRRRRRKGGNAVTCWIDEVARQCAVPRTCSIAQRCSFPRRCNVPKSCDDVGTVTDCLKSIWEAIGVDKQIVDFVMNVANTFKQILKFFENVVEWLVDFFVGLFQAIVDGILHIVEAIVGAISDLFNTLMDVINAVAKFVNALADIFLAVAQFGWLEGEVSTEVVVDASLNFPMCVPGSWMIWPGKEVLQAFVSLGKIFSQGVNQAPQNWKDCKNYFSTAFSGYHNYMLGTNLPFFDTPVGNMCFEILHVLFNAVMTALEIIMDVCATIADAIMSLIKMMGFLTAIGKMVEKQRQDVAASDEEIMESIAGGEEVALATVVRRRRRRRRAFNKNSLNTADPDHDNDGRQNDADAFPTDPTEQDDTDRDGRGDNSDVYLIEGSDDDDSGVESSNRFVLDKDKSFCRVFDTDNLGGDWLFSMGAFPGFYGGWRGWPGTPAITLPTDPGGASDLVNPDGPSGGTLPAAGKSWCYNITTMLQRILIKIWTGMHPNLHLFYVGFTLAVGCKFNTFIPPQYQQELWILFVYVDIGEMIRDKTADKPPGMIPQYGQCYFKGVGFGIFIVYADYGISHPISVADTGNRAYHRLGIYVNLAIGVAWKFSACGSGAISTFMTLPLLPYYYLTPKNHDDCSTQKKSNGRCKHSAMNDAMWTNTKSYFDDRTRENVLYRLGMTNKGGSFWVNLRNKGKDQSINPLTSKGADAFKADYVKSQSCSWQVLLDEIDETKPLSEAGDLTGPVADIYRYISHQDIEEEVIAALGVGGRHPAEQLVSMFLGSSSWPVIIAITFGVMFFLTFCPAYVDYGSGFGHHCSGQVYDVSMMFKDFWWHFLPPSGNSLLLAEVDAEEGSGLAEYTHGVMGALGWIPNPGRSTERDSPDTSDSDWALTEAVKSESSGIWNGNEMRWGSGDTGEDAYPVGNGGDSFTGVSPACPGVDATCFNGVFRRSLHFNQLTNRFSTF